MTTTTPPLDHHSATVAHEHAADLETCLSLVNTLELTDGLPDDGLRTQADALAWLEERDLGHAGPLEEQAELDGAAWLARVHGVRAAIRSTWDAVVDGRPPAAPALETLNATLAASPVPQLHALGGAVIVGHRHHDGDPTGEALARVVAPLVAALATGDTARFRVCANDGCRWVFEDTSRSGRRRWCDMTTCGNRAKVRRFRTRQRDGRDDDPGGSASRTADPAGA